MFEHKFFIVKNVTRIRNNDDYSVVYHLDSKEYSLLLNGNVIYSLLDIKFDELYGKIISLGSEFRHVFISKDKRLYPVDSLFTYKEICFIVKNYNFVKEIEDIYTLKAIIRL